MAGRRSRPAGLPETAARLDVRAQSPDEGQSPGQKFRPHAGELVVPGIQGRRHRRRHGPPPGPLAWEAEDAATRPREVRAPADFSSTVVAHDPLIVRTDRGVPRGRGDQQVVQEAPPFAGIAFDQGQVLRVRTAPCAARRADLPGPGQRGPV